MTVLNLRLKKGVELHESIHGFQGERGGGGTLEAKMYQQLAGISHKPLFQFFLDVQKAYDLLDRGIFLEILMGYRLGNNLTRLLGHYW